MTPNFRVVCVEDCEAVEVCGALKVNIYLLLVKKKNLPLVNRVKIIWGRIKFFL